MAISIEPIGQKRNSVARIIYFAREAATPKTAKTISTPIAM
jgi:hypothetical protein